MQFTVPMAPAAWGRGTGGPGGTGPGPGPGGTGPGAGPGGTGPGPGACGTGPGPGGGPSASGPPGAGPPRGAGPVAEKMKDSPKRYSQILNLLDTSGVRD